MFRLCKRRWRMVKMFVLPFKPDILSNLLSSTVCYLLSHERLAVLQMVPLHDGGAMKFSQRMCAPFRKKQTNIGKQTYTHAPNFLHMQNKWSRLALSGKGCWSLCGRYRGRKQQPPWQRHLDQSSTSSAFLSVSRRDKSQSISCRYLGINNTLWTSYGCLQLCVCSTTNTLRILQLWSEDTTKTS